MNDVLPGWIDSLPATEERRENVPMQRYGTIEEIAATIAFLAPYWAGILLGRIFAWMGRYPGAVRLAMAGASSRRHVASVSTLHQVLRTVILNP